MKRGRGGQYLQVQNQLDNQTNADKKEKQRQADGKIQVYISKKKGRKRYQRQDLKVVLEKGWLCCLRELIEDGD